MGRAAAMKPRRRPGPAPSSVPSRMTLAPYSAASVKARLRFARVAQLAVGIVFDDGQVQLGGTLDQRDAAFQAERAAGGVLEVGQRVEEARAAGQLGRDGLGDQAAVIGEHRHVLGLVQAERLQRAQVAGVFDQDLAVLVDQHLAQQVQRLLRAGHDQDLVGRHVGAGAGQVFGDPLAQRRVAFGRAVLQRGAPVGGQDLVERSAYHFHRKPPGAGRPPANEMTSGRSVTLRISRMAELVSC